jgi:hypothetical protein
LLVHRGVPRELEREQALAHRGSCGDDIESSVLEAAEKSVEIADARGKPGDGAIILGGLFESVDFLRERVLEQSLAG